MGLSNIDLSALEDPAALEHEQLICVDYLEEQGSPLVNSWRFVIQYGFRPLGPLGDEEDHSQWLWISEDYWVRRTQPDTHRNCWLRSYLFNHMRFSKFTHCNKASRDGLWKTYTSAEAMIVLVEAVHHWERLGFPPWRDLSIHSRKGNPDG